ncbi:hypothetical protein AAZX31_02G201500 [Glycine max]|uniref:Metalloproteinase n=2 Tax=Glycine subgen. Soja TaxID=1462606 RepID=I1JH15_SOYBN|nr:metalloendoproteinase 1 precursor [Glycine max]XP_028213210.1 metalloendoproteinase 1 [Glycine soja]KAG5052645.1 hypothetical protein JHK87_004843 [Glycine soja]KAG5063999.1 hypothetical protein JHK85_005182 [Glycine max]KAG5080953.1 hypothetical protein JHK86_005018 [Glycine max]KAH1061473.1 hypothetical protein GYH30_004791 [Glycine max]KAH1262807.1 Metalloendoproteinase 1 [Glycine max]|eukprot:NP_001235535.2 metalloendoproteinase 1 precursor [Glycine max]
MTLRNHQELLVALAILYFLATSLPSVSAHGPYAWDGEATYKFTTYHPGQNYKGLSNVKNYFHHLGYIPNAPHFDDNFDDTLVSAIKTYQKNYNLNVTGKFDINTLKQIMTPRCGVPDIIINTNKTTSFGMISDYTFFKDMPRWQAGTTQLTYAFSPEPRLDDTFKSAIARAFSKWTPVVNIAFQETTSYETANIKILFASKNHGDPYPFDGPGGILGHAFAPTDGRCHFDADEYWVASGDVTKSPVTSAFDLESVAVHEIGHLLGLGHSSDLRAIMYPSIPPRTRKVNLAQDDIDGIRKLYGINP